MLAKKIITAKQMKTYRAKNSSVMKDFLGKGGGEIIHRKVYQKELWSALRDDSKSHEFGERGYTKKGLTDFLGKLLVNDKDHLTDRKVKKIADLWGVKRSKLYNAAANVRADQSREKIQERLIESQKHQQQQIENQKHQQRESEINSHINQIISKGREKAQAGSQISSSNTSSKVDIKHAGNYSNNEKKNNNTQENVLTKFSVSYGNIRKSEENFIHPSDFKYHENNSNAFGHLMFLKNRQYDKVGEEDAVEDAKARLARIQGRTDNKEVAE